MSSIIVVGQKKCNPSMQKLIVYIQEIDIVNKIRNPKENAGDHCTYVPVSRLSQTSTDITSFSSH